MYVKYSAEVEVMAYGRIPRDTLAKALSSGRQSGVLLEYEISEIFGATKGSQGAGADLIDARLGTIQCKTYKSAENPTAVFERGKNRGTLKIAEAKIWTTKSGYFDRVKRMTDEDHRDAEEYFSRYQTFMYIDIRKMAERKYSFVAVPSGDVIRKKAGYYISEEAINSLVVREEAVPPGHLPECPHRLLVS